MFRMVILGMGTIIVLVACTVSDESSEGDNSSATYTIGGTLTGLSRSGQVVLQNNSGDDLTISANGAFVFATALTDGSGYAVTVLSDPSTPSQACTVSTGSGTLSGADVSSISVSCVDTFTEYVYVSNSWSNTVSVIDTTTDTVVDTVTVGSNPRGLDGTPDGQLVFVANRDSNSVSAIDTATNAVTQTILLTGNQPYNLEVTPDGSTVYVVMKTTDGGTSGTPGTVSIIDVSTLVETGTITLVGESPEGIAISPDGLSVYAINRESATVDVINTATQAVTELISTSSFNPRDAVVIGNKLLVVNDSGSGVDVIDIASGTVTTSITGTCCRDVDRSPDGSKAYVTTTGSNLKVIDVATETLANTIAITGSGSYGVSVNFAGSRAYVSMNWSDSLVIVDLDNETETGTQISVGNEPRQVTVVPVPN